MPTKKTETSTALAEVPVQTIAVPSFMTRGDTRGTERITNDDVIPPSLRLAQSNSPEVKRSEVDRYIPGLTEGMFFNSMTKEIYGEGPLQFVVVNQLGHRHVEFDRSLKVVDLFVPDNDPRTQFTTQVVDGVQKRIKPAATKFYDYLILLVRGQQRDLMTFSLSGTQIKKATKKLNPILKFGGLPSFAHLITVSATPEHDGSFSWYGFKFEESWPSEDLYLAASALYDQLAGTPIVIDASMDAVDTSNADADGAY
jgi:hypothetical protein